MKIYLLFFSIILNGWSQEVIYSGDKIVVQGDLYKALDDYYIQTKEGLSLLVLGEVDYYKDDLKSATLEDGESVSLKISGTYHNFTDGAGKQIHSIIAERSSHKILKSLSLKRGDSKDPYYLIEPPAYSWEQTSFGLKSELKNFMLPYLTYVRKVDTDYQKSYQEWQKLGNTSDSYMDSIYQRSQRWESFFKYSSLFYKFTDALEIYRAKFEKNFKSKIDPSNTYVRVVKKDFLIYLLEKETDKVVFVFPMSYGGNPDGKSKAYDSDYRTPESPKEKRSYKTTPLQIKRRLKYSAAPGMTTRLMGIQSQLEEDKFWVKFGMNIVIHGSPVSSSIGTKASHGCMRLFDKDALSLFELTDDTTPVVIE
ncbi:MAG: L,D-transpeptidase [Candidatus Cloacimonetes bacterium]|nr:L,D-transpeptidase [Candidatus Cloacimonadota bacterium]